jgi:hypothetical protein
MENIYQIDLDIIFLNINLNIIKGPPEQIRYHLFLLFNIVLYSKRCEI